MGATTTDTFTYTISDGNGGTDTATVTITVTGVNDAPSAGNDTGATDEDTVLNVAATGVLANDSDPDTGDSLTVTAFDATSTKGATVSVAANGSYSYDPTGSATLNALAAGVTTTDTFTYTISDGNGGTDTATVTITITGANDTPVAVVDTGFTGENEIKSFDVLANDTDVDLGDVPANFTLTTASIASVSGLSTDPNAPGASVSIVSNQVRFNPGTAFDELDPGDTATVVVNYTMRDTSGATSNSTLTITVNGVNDAPVAVNDTASTPENGVADFDVLANDTDVDGDDNPSNFTLVSANSVSATGLFNNNERGTISIVNNKIRFDPGNDFDQLDSGQTATVVVSYTMADDSGAQSTATLTITVVGDRCEPLGIDDIVTIHVNPNNGTITTKEEVQVDIEVLAASVQSGSTWLPVTGRIRYNGGTPIVVFQGTQPQLDGYADGHIFYTNPTVAAGTNILFGGNYSSSTQYWTETSPYPANTIVLTHGDDLPAYLPLSGQQSLASFIDAYVDDNGKIDIDPTQVIIIMEVGTTNTNSTAFDMQDLVMLVTFTATAPEPGTCP